MCEYITAGLYKNIFVLVFRSTIFGISLSLPSSLATQDEKTVRPNPTIVSDQPNLVGGNHDVGPIVSIGISSTPLGFAFVYGGERPDIFVNYARIRFPP